MGAHAREDAVGQANRGRPRRDEAAALCEEHDQGRLAEIGRLSSHVWARQDHDLLLVGIEDRVVGDEGSGRERRFHEGMAAGQDLEDVASGLGGAAGGVNVAVTGREQDALEFHRSSALVRA